MPNTRVMVVDDSAAMRALFCGILENAQGVEVCGTASNADEARDKLDDLRPDVLTLDVEMPGMSGLDFLTEIMETRPMPVIMLSSIAQEGTGTAKRALDLGAVHCFPKPLNCSGAEFDATVAELGSIVLKAAKGELEADEPTAPEEGSPAEAGDYEPDGRIVVLAGGAGGLDAAKLTLAAFPDNCPPTVVLVDAPGETLGEAAESWNGSLACQVHLVADGTALEPGCAYIAADKGRHVVIEAGSPPRLRLVARDPISGARPSADLLFGSLAKAKVPTLGGLLVGSGPDGVKGLQMLSQVGGKTFVQKPADYEPADKADAVASLKFGAELIEREAMGGHILDSTTKA